MVWDRPTYHPCKRCGDYEVHLDGGENMHPASRWRCQGCGKFNSGVDGARPGQTWHSHFSKEFKKGEYPMHGSTVIYTIEGKTGRSVATPCHEQMHNLFSKKSLKRVTEVVESREGRLVAYLKGGQGQLDEVVAVGDEDYKEAKSVLAQGWGSWTVRIAPDKKPSWWEEGDDGLGTR